MNILKKLSEKHNTWLGIVRSFGADNPEDIVQDMYIKIFNWSERNKDKDILYDGDQVNHYFVFKTLRSLFINECKKNKVCLDIDDIDIEHNPEDQTDTELIQEKLAKLYWYDRKVFEYVYLKNFSMLQLSEMTGISYYSIKRTILKVKKQLK